jgi:AcrR family transcriptional regulator
VRHAERVRQAMQEAILDAVEQLLPDRGWPATRMADVADRAEVSRQTVYQLYGSREGLAQAYVLREADRFLSTVESAARAGASTPEAAIEAALDVFLTGAADNLMVKAILAGNSDGLLPLVTTHAAPVLDLARERLIRVVLDLAPEVDPADARLFAESAARLAISHVTTPTTDPQRASADLTRLLSPFLARVSGREQPGP